MVISGTHTFTAWVHTTYLLPHLGLPQTFYCLHTWDLFPVSCTHLPKLCTHSVSTPPHTHTFSYLHHVLFILFLQSSILHYLPTTHTTYTTFCHLSHYYLGSYTTTFLCLPTSHTLQPSPHPLLPAARAFLRCIFCTGLCCRTFRAHTVAYFFPFPPRLPPLFCILVCAGLVGISLPPPFRTAPAYAPCIALLPPPLRFLRLLHCTACPGFCLLPVMVSAVCHTCHHTPTCYLRSRQFSSPPQFYYLPTHCHYHALSTVIFFCSSTSHFRILCIPTDFYTYILPPYTFCLTIPATTYLLRMPGSATTAAGSLPVTYTTTCYRLHIHSFPATGSYYLLLLQLLHCLLRSPRTTTTTTAVGRSFAVLERYTCTTCCLFAFFTVLPAARIFLFHLRLPFLHFLYLLHTVHHTTLHHCCCLPAIPQTCLYTPYLGLHTTLITTCLPTCFS